MGKMSREKGKRGERSVASLFREHGYEAHRTAQYRGNTGDAGDVEGIPYLHLEVKFQERMRLYDWMEQSVHDAKEEGKGNIPIVVHKQNHKEVLVTMRFEDFMKMYKEYEYACSESK